MIIFKRQLGIFVCMLVTVLSFVMILLLDNFTQYEQISESAMTAIWIGAEGKSAVTKCANGCHFSCRRHGCSWYNSPCIEANKNCPTGDFGRMSVVSASCQQLEPSGTKTCKLIKKLVAFNKCNYTGEKDLESIGCVNSTLVQESPKSCAIPEGKKRCVIRMSVRWDATTSVPTLVFVEANNSVQCKNDPALYNENETGKYRALCNDYGGIPLLSGDKLEQTRTIYTKRSDGTWIKIKQKRTRSTVTQKTWGSWENLSEEVVEEMNVQ
jgi:hypothetical protein